MRRILLLGPPRSGSTWVSEVLGAVPGSLRLHEPDSDPHVPYALIAKAGLGRYPILGSGDRSERYETLWSAAFTPRPAHGTVRDSVASALLRSTDLDTRNAILFRMPSKRAQLTERALRAVARPVSPALADLHVIKSVHSPASAGFVTSLTDATVVVIRRNPLNAVASWLELGWRPQRIGGSDADALSFEGLVGAPAPSASAPIEAHHAWSFAALTRALDIEAAAHPDWLVVQHEDLCRDPAAEFRRLFERLDLPFGPEVEASLREHDRPASGYETKRVARDQAERWRERLDSEQADLIRSTAESLSITC